MNFKFFNIHDESNFNVDMFRSVDYLRWSNIIFSRITIFIPVLFRESDGKMKENGSFHGKNLSN